MVIEVVLYKLYIGGVSNFGTKISSKNIGVRLFLSERNFSTKSLDDRPVDGQLRSAEVSEVDGGEGKMSRKLHGFHFCKELP